MSALRLGVGLPRKTELVRFLPKLQDEREDQAMTSYFDLIESTINRLISAMAESCDCATKEPEKLAHALRSMVAKLHAAQHSSGRHLPVDVKELEKLLELYGVKRG